MKKLTLLFVIGVLSVSIQNVYAQDIDYLRKANEAYIKGNYSYAVTMYKMYFAETGKDISALQRQAEQCRDYLKAGDDAAVVNDYVTAKQNYQKILSLNPEDSSVQTKLASINSTPSTPTNLKVGDEYLGGTVAFIDNTGRHGFIIHSVSKNPISDEKSEYNSSEKARDSCPQGLRLPSRKELSLMAPYIEKLPLYLGEWYFVSDYRWCFYIKKQNLDKKQRKKQGREFVYEVAENFGPQHYLGFAIYLKDF